MSFFGSASRILERLEPSEDDLRCSTDTLEGLSPSQERIYNFLQLEDDEFDDDFDESVDVDSDEEPITARKPALATVKPTNLPEGACSICLDDFENCKETVLSCGHRFCSDCLQEHIKNEVHSNVQFKHQISLLVPTERSWKLVVKTIFGVRCPAYGCSGILTSEIIRDLADEVTFKKFDYFALKETLDDLYSGGGLRLCTECQNGFIQEDCLCSDVYCRERTLKLRNTEEKRRRRRWERENSTSHRKFGLWMSQAHVRCCPKCFSAIEKNLGCDHMYCAKCKHHFLWSQAPAFGTGEHWWRPQQEKKNGRATSSSSTMPAPAAVQVAAQ